MEDQETIYVFTWHIKNVSMCPKKIGDRIKSPLFKAENISEDEWYLSFYPRGKDSEYDKHVSCYLHRVGKKKKEKIHLELEMIGNDGISVRSLKSDASGIGDTGYGFKYFALIEELKSMMENWINDILTIRCRMRSETTSINQPAIEGVAQSTICVDRCGLKWNISIPDSPLWKNNKVLYLSKKSHFKLTISAPGDDFEIDLRRMKVGDCQYVSCKISLMSLKQKEIKSKAATHLFNDDEESWRFPNFLSKTDLLARVGNSIRNNILTFKCEISASNGEIVSEVLRIRYGYSSPANTYFTDSTSVLTEDLRNLLESQSNSDIKLRVESLLIPAHKLILSARSPVFKAMFEQNMLENSTGIVDIQDLDAKTVNLLLEFIYTGFVSTLDFENAMKLLIAANKYQITSLYEKCSFFLSSVMTIGNVCDVYAVADMINHNDLKSSALQFIKINSTEILQSATWSDWIEENMKLANEILTKLALNSIH